MPGGMFRLRLRVWANVPLPLVTLAPSTFVPTFSGPAFTGAVMPVPAGRLLPVSVRFDEAIIRPPGATKGDAETITFQPRQPDAVME